MRVCIQAGSLTTPSRLLQEVSSVLQQIVRGVRIVPYKSIVLHAARSTEGDASVHVCVSIVPQVQVLFCMTDR